MYARSRGVARDASDCAFFTSSSAFGSSVGSIEALMLGPSTKAWPQYAMGFVPSSRATSANDRAASA